MVISTERSYSRDDLQVLDLVDHPVWVFDIMNKCMWWANHEAVSFWNASSLEELLDRDFASDMSETVRKKNLDTLDRFRRKERVRESVSDLEDHDVSILYRWDTEKRFGKYRTRTHQRPRFLGSN